MDIKQDQIFTLKGKVYTSSKSVLEKVAGAMNLSSGEDSKQGYAKVLDQLLSVAEEDEGVKLAENLMEEFKKAEAEEVKIKAEMTRPDIKMSDFNMHEKEEVTSKIDDLPVLWRKDFKVAGQVAKEGGINYISLTRQIDAGLAKGFTEAEIIEGLIRAISPSVQLRSYLEGKSNLDIKTVRQLLRTHFKEPTATELYKKLCNISQLHGEDPITYMMRALDLKQKVIIAAKEDLSIVYTEQTVDGMFIHAVQTGFVDDAIRHQMRDVLKVGTADVEILSQLNRITLTETEHQSKVKIQSSSCKVNTIGSHTNSNSKPKRKSRKCKNCEESGQKCEHCHKCGSEEHFAAGCRNYLNKNRLLKKEGGQ